MLRFPTAIPLTALSCQCSVRLPPRSSTKKLLSVGHSRLCTRASGPGSRWPRDRQPRYPAVQQLPGGEMIFVGMYTSLEDRPDAEDQRGIFSDAQLMQPRALG